MLGLTFADMTQFKLSGLDVGFGLGQELRQRMCLFSTTIERGLSTVGVLLLQRSYKYSGQYQMHGREERDR